MIETPGKLGARSFAPHSSHPYRRALIRLCEFRVSGVEKLPSLVYAFLAGKGVVLAGRQTRGLFFPISSAFFPARGFLRLRFMERGGKNVFP